MTCQHPSLRAEISTKIWMSGLNQNYNMTPLHSARNSRIYRRNSKRISLSSDWWCHFVFAVPTSGTTPPIELHDFLPTTALIMYKCVVSWCVKKCNTDSKVCETTILLNPKKLFITLLGTCIIYTTMYTTEIPRHSSGNTYHCHKGSHLVSRVDVHIRNPVEPKLCSVER